MGLPSDVVRAQTGVSEAIFSLDVARNNAAVSRVDLATSMGVDPRTPIQTSDQDEPIQSVTDVGQLVQTAQLRRPEVLQAQANLLSAKYGESAARNSNAPSIAAVLGVTGRGTDTLPGTEQLNVGATLVWTPFDSGFTSGKVKEARGFVDAAKAALDSTRLTVTSDVSQSYLTLRTAEHRVTSSDAEVANAQEGVRLAEGRYRAGLGTFIDLTDAQSALLTAQTNRVNARTALNLAKAALSRAIGAALPK
jgi:outer membrane protein